MQDQAEMATGGVDFKPGLDRVLKRNDPAPREADSLGGMLNVLAGHLDNLLSRSWDILPPSEFPENKGIESEPNGALDQTRYCLRRAELISNNMDRIRELLGRL